MAAQNKGKPTRFIRKNGKIIPIYAKDPSRAQMNKNYKKHGDGANQASRIDAKYEKRAVNNKRAKLTGAAAATAFIGGIAADVKGRPLLGASLFALGLGAAIVGHRAQRKQRSKDAGKRENDYVRTFGTGSDGEKPFRKRRRLSGTG